eukprot:gnl/TRDRNA2_/TRDRNA2_90257_c0_seq1.p1 gnl/TRDRNA2_/TRDRNA2_90257_c0~~gnl/TRDRNA2_/TRDRNA2_90257_c0_seq1.p1  ORF type:complete len:265 (-),score=29.68 gnl/TRDRNA2_/TRDRNA2_90257_c0_seq1:94-888(-)
MLPQGSVVPAIDYLDCLWRYGLSGETSEPRGLRVIVAGAPRTGTYSLTQALRILGYRAAHGDYLRCNTTARELWRRWWKPDGAGIERAIATLRDGSFDAAVGMPYSFTFQELLKHNPEAKVILNVHPNGALAWLMSVEELFRPHAGGGEDPQLTFTLQNFYRYLRCPVHEAFSTTHRERCVQCYIDHIEAVRREVPQGQLLEYNVSNGWEPLCRFLGTPIPTAPFPGSRVYLASQTVLLCALALSLCFCYCKFCSRVYAKRKKC